MSKELTASQKLQNSLGTVTAKVYEQGLTGSQIAIVEFIANVTSNETGEIKKSLDILSKMILSLNVDELKSIISQVEEKAGA
jgi:hypothetical protein